MVARETLGEIASTKMVRVERRGKAEMRVREIWEEEEAKAFIRRVLAPSLRCAFGGQGGRFHDDRSG